MKNSATDLVNDKKPSNFIRMTCFPFSWVYFIFFLIHHKLYTHFMLFVEFILSIIYI